MNYCKQCNEPLSDDAIFCPKCGCKVTIPAQHFNSSNVQNKKKSNTCSILSIIFGIIGIIPLLNFIFLPIAILLAIIGIAKSNTRKSAIIVANIIVVVLSCIFSIAWMIPACSPSNDTHRDIAIECAQDELKSQNFKNPQSLQIHDSIINNEFENSSYYYYKITLDYSAQNGFGGYNRNSFEVCVKVNKSTQQAIIIDYSEYVSEYSSYVGNLTSDYQ